MLAIRRSADRGHACHGWLDSRHTFSFADYHDPRFMGFGALRVLNQDRIAGGGGFPTHPHRDMEIVTLVLEGALEHRDSMGNGSQMRPGDVQLMSAGAGVTHSEYNPSPTDPLHLLQMWIIPATRGTPPRYEQRATPRAARLGKLKLVVSPEGRDGAVAINQDARLWTGIFEDGDETRFELPSGRQAWLHVATGAININGQRLGPGDGAAITDENALNLSGIEEAQIALWDLPT